MPDKIYIDYSGLNPLLRQLNDSPQRLERTTRLAANSAMRSANTKTRRMLAGELGIPQKHIKNRLRYAAAKKDNSVTSSGLGANASRDAFARLWIGLNRIAARKKYFGRLEEIGRGATAKDYYFEGGFIGHRTSTKGPSIYKRIGAGRFPIKLQGIEIDTPSVRRKIDLVAIGAEEKYTDEIKRLIRVDWEKAKGKKP